MTTWQWVWIGLAAASLILGVWGYWMFGFGGGLRRYAAPKRDMRTTWKVVQLGGPLPDGVGLPASVKFGVIISTNAMLEQAQTLLFCPLFDGVDEKTQKPLAVLPWHVQVEIRQDPDKHFAEVPYGRKYVSTKIVLPIGYNEVDTDGLERGYLDEHSQALVSKKLALWMPQFARR
jgi:hypothetical protein